MNQPATHCRNSHEYTPENTRYDADGTRRCVTCRRAESARYRAIRQARALEAGDCSRSPHQRKFPVAPLLPFVEPEKLAMTDLRAFERSKKSGRIGEAVADRIVCAMGLHPALIWGEQWWEDVAS